MAPYRRVLDLASSDAKLRHYIRRDVFYLGADISAESFAKLKVDQFNSFRVGDIASRPFFLSDEEPFDLVISTHTFHHVPGHLRPIALRNLVSVMASKGYLILQLTDADFNSLSAALNELLELRKRIRYRGILSAILSRGLSPAFHRSSFGGKISFWLSFIDPPPFSRNLLVFQKS